MGALELLRCTAAGGGRCGDDCGACSESRGQVLDAVHDADLQRPELYHPAGAPLLDGGRVDLHRWPSLEWAAVEGPRAP